MRPNVSLHFLAILFLVWVLFPGHVRASQPNILFVYVDDLGWKDTGYMGSDFYETPNIDRLAKGGMIFTDAYSCAAGPRQFDVRDVYATTQDF